MVNIIRILLLTVTLTLLSSCGGGGSSSGGSSGGGSGSAGPSTEPGSLSFDRTSVSFSANQYGDTPAAQIVNVSFDAPLVTLGYPVGVLEPYWLFTQLNQTSTTSGNVLLGIRDTNLVPGTYTTTIRAVVSDLAGSVVYNTADVEITLVVNEGLSIEASTGEISVEIAPVQAPVSQTITLTGEGINWSYSSPNSRISASPSSGTIPAGGQDVAIVVSADANAQAGTEATRITFQDSVYSMNGASVNIMIDTLDGVVTSPRQLMFLADARSTATQSQLIEVDNFDVTTASQVNWTVTPDQPWLNTATPSGSIDTAAMPSSPSELSVIIDPAGLSIGRYDGALTFTNDVSAQLFETPVSVVVAEPTVKASRKGVALSTLSKVEEILTVTNGAGADIAWQASSNENWLTVTASGSAGQDLTLTASPAGLANNSLSEAIVTINSAAPGNSGTMTVNVGFWNSDETPSTSSIALDQNEENRFERLAVDPIRPYIYVLSHSMPSFGELSSNLRVFNIYTGEQVGDTIATPFTDSASIEISDDGEQLFVLPVYDTTQYARYDLAGLGAGTIVELSDGISYNDMSFMRVNGVPILLSGTGRAFNPETGQLISELHAFSGNNISTSANGVICLSNSVNGFIGELSCFDVLGTGVTGGDVYASPRDSSALVTSPRDFVTAKDGTAVFHNETSVLTAFSTDDGARLFTIADVSSAKVSNDGTLNVTGIGYGSSFTGDTFRTYTSDGLLIGTVNLVDGSFSTAVLSSDGARGAHYYSPQGGGGRIDFFNAP